MKAIRIREPGPPEVLEPADVEAPRPGPGQAAIAVHATAVNRADLLQRRGAYPAPPGAPPDIPGLEFAGVVDGLGPGTDPSLLGRRVMGILGGGGYAERVVVDASHLVPVPDGLDLVAAAALPEAFWTAFDALVLQGELGPGTRVLVHAAGSGVGTAALQVARAFGAARIFGTASAGKLRAIAALGLPLDVPIDYRAASFREVVLRETGGDGVDLVLDLVGAPYWDDNLACLAPRGRVLLVGLTGGATARVDLGRLLRGRVTVIGTVLRARPAAEKAALADRVRADLLPRFAAGELRPVVDRVLPLDRVAEAHEVMEANRNAGKIVLRIRG
ncbi:MAG: NAD(P)H-quinone oxidoreductase [Gemmatimonadota bacterium]|nr:NAD(P)H-quinone oxidoreductase [Gemmatimonadota bacterium]